MSTMNEYNFRWGIQNSKGNIWKIKIFHSNYLLHFILSVTPKLFQCNESLKYKESPIFRAEVQNSWSSTLFKFDIEFPL